MSTRSPQCRPTVIAGGLAVAALLSTACGGSDSTSSTSPQKPASGGVQQETSLAGKVPAAFKKDGKITVATSPSYAPMEFYATDNKTIIGVDPDLGRAIGQVLGVPFAFQRAGFDGIIPGLAGGRYELSMSSFTDNKQREKAVDFVTYFSAGTSMMVRQGNPEQLATSDDSLCGKTVAAAKGTVQIDADIPARSRKCRAAGKPAVQPLGFPDSAGPNLALSSGRADAVLADSPVAQYIAKKSNGRLEVVGASYENAPFGIAIPKTAGSMKEAVRGALAKLIADGTYRQILTKWGVDQGGITTPTVNGAQ